jgi:hypothetical protein
MKIWNNIVYNLNWIEFEISIQFQFNQIEFKCIEWNSNWIEFQLNSGLIELNSNTVNETWIELN